MRRLLLALSLSGFVSGPAVWAQGQNQLQEPPKSNPTREFIMSCTYGVLAGTLVGAASLAFVDKPSDNLNKVARGASLGLYTGILLGLYVVYVVPSMEDGPPAEEDYDPVVMLTPRFDVGQLDGVDFSWKVLSF
ncbi:MAG: hypothetical protein AB7F86_20020 [Bdellovibrionales bacterium]